MAQQLELELLVLFLEKLFRRRVDALQYLLLKFLIVLRTILPGNNAREEKQAPPGTLLPMPASIRESFCSGER